MIEPTGEMIDAFWAGHDEAEDGGDERGLAAVLAIVERDYWVEPRPPCDPPPSCVKCGSRLQRCCARECVNPARCGDAWCAHHAPGGAW